MVDYDDRDLLADRTGECSLRDPHGQVAVDLEKTNVRITDLCLVWVPVA